MINIKPYYDIYINRTMIIVEINFNFFFFFLQNYKQLITALIIMIKFK